MPTSNPNDADESTTVRDHPRFFFDDTLVVVQVENVRFKVHKYQLVQSETFADIFAAAEQAESEGKPVEGSSRETPIKLEDATASDFEALLAVRMQGKLIGFVRWGVIQALNNSSFPSFRQFSAHKSEPDSSLIIPAFRLANKWGFSDLRAYLMPLAEKAFDDVDKILFAQEFGLDDWVIPAYTRLCQREKMLSSEEATKIGAEGVLLISRIREEWHTNVDKTTIAACCGYTSVTCCNCGSWLNLSVSRMPEDRIRGKIDTWVKNGRAFAAGV